MTVWFTSDHHFGHANIIKHCNRPFGSADEMTEVMIARWNERIRNGDMVYHLGDFFSFKGREVSFGQAQSIKRRLNGSIVLIRGNHDVQWWLGNVFPVAHDYKVLKPYKAVLFHYPIENWDGKWHQWVHLHGHSHGMTPAKERRFDVGVDCHDFYPVTLDQLLEKQA